MCLLAYPAGSAQLLRMVWLMFCTAQGVCVLAFIGLGFINLGLSVSSTSIIHDDFNKCCHKAASTSTSWLSDYADPPQHSSAAHSVRSRWNYPVETQQNDPYGLNERSVYTRKDLFWFPQIKFQKFHIPQTFKKWSPWKSKFLSLRVPLQERIVCLRFFFLFLTAVSCYLLQWNLQVTTNILIKSSADLTWV